MSNSSISVQFAVVAFLFVALHSLYDPAHSALTAMNAFGGVHIQGGNLWMIDDFLLCHFEYLACSLLAE